MKREEICFMSACEMVEKIRTQELSSQEITEIVIERIERINPFINAFCTPTFDLAREMAKNADDAVKKGDKLGLLQGLPTSIKDETETKGIRTTFGSRLFEHNIPKEDEIAVKRLKEAGIVLLGKTNTPAFGYKGVTDNLLFGKTKNPWDLGKTSGGSSGGAAASIAAGLGALALGSDGGGSIRIPSSFCGVYGIKASFGRVPHPTMKIAGILGTLVGKGPIVRYVKDAALMLDAIVGADDSDRYSIPHPNISYLEKLEEEPKKLKIGYSLSLGHAKAVDPEVRKVVLDAVQKFERFGWTVEEGKIRLRKPDQLMMLVWTSSFAHLLRPVPKDVRRKLDQGLVVSADIGLKYSVKDIKEMELQREILFGKVCKFFKKYDLLVTPTTACPAFRLGMDGPNEIDGKEIFPFLGWLPFTYPFNLSGHPAASIPCGWSREGLPIGMQIVGKRYDEVTILQVSQAFEELQPWQEKRPQFS